MTKNLGNIIAVCLIVIGFGTLIQVKAFAKLKGEDARRLPIGERQYVIDESKRYAPVEIQAVSSTPRDSEKKAVTVLRDPVRPGADAKSPDLIKKRAPKVEYRVVKGPAKAKQLRFGKIAVNGSLVEPRVKFERSNLEIGRAEEPTKAQFFHKISEVTNDW